MSTDFKSVGAGEINAAIAEAIEARLALVLSHRQPGHCMRVADLDTDVMRLVARRLAAHVGKRAQIHVLSQSKNGEDSVFITSTKLVELRNPFADGTQRPPLLVFVPNELKASAEDSFSEATFQTLSLKDTYDELRRKLIGELPVTLQSAVADVLTIVREADWRWADALSSLRYLLCLKLNDYDPDVAGAALFELGLVPDLRLLDDPTRTRSRIARNLESVRKLVFSTRTERGRVLELGLSDRLFAAKLAETLIAIGGENPVTWAKQLIYDRSLRDLTFDKWQFESGEAGAGKVCVQILDFGVDVLTADKGDGRFVPLVGQRVLLVGQHGQTSLRVKFSCDPHPARAPFVDHFRLQIVSRESGPMGLIKKKERWDTGKPEKTISFGNLKKHNWEEGWHFIRVTAYTDAGDPVPLVDDKGVLLPLSTSDDPKDSKPAFNESDLFYVIKNDDYELEPSQRAVAKMPSRTHADLSLRFKAIINERPFELVQCAEVAWSEESANSALRSLEMLELHFGREGLVHVPVAKVLKVIEQRILQSPDSPISWRVRVESGTPTDPKDDVSGWPASPALGAFLAARTAYFSALRGEDGRRITQSVDLLPLRSAAVAYGESYLAFVRSLMKRVGNAPDGEKATAVADLQRILIVDAVNVDLTDHRGARRHAVLLGPTHPLRAIWLSAWNHLGSDWLRKASVGPKQFVTAIRDSLLERLNLIGFPAVLPVGAGKLYAPVDNIHSFWTLYAATTDPDPRGLVAEICTALALPEPTLGSFNLTGGYLADRVRRYLVQHPYVHTLVLNCFNAGRGKVLADMLLELQKSDDLADLCYDIRIFVPDPDLAGIGDDLGELISPSSSITAKEADPFAQPSGRLLAPKLTYSVRALTEFAALPAAFSAHITLLFDVFPAQDVGAASSRADDEAAPIHGLLQDYSVDYAETGDVVSWQRKPRHADARPIPEAEDLSLVLSRLAATLSSASATVATQETGLEMRPVTRLVLSPENKALLHQVHEFSDWVFTVDRNLGIEFFDNAQSVRRPEYLIDHSPDIASNAGRRVVVTSRSLTEIESLFGRALSDYDFVEFKDRSAALLGHLRALSGRLALKLLSSPAQRAEAFGLALSKVFLERLGALSDQVVVPLDAHLELFRGAKQDADPFADEVSLRRTDLALFDLNANEMVITCSLVEVKCYRNTGSVAGFARLRESIADQIEQSEVAVRSHFDPERAGALDRADRVIKTQEFKAFLEFYVDRAARLGLLGEEARNEAKVLLRRLENGYRLRFTRSSVIFDFDQTGADAPLEEFGVEFHRVGRDVVRELLEGMSARSREEVTGDIPTAAPQPPGIRSRLNEGTYSRGAAFLAKKRDRTQSTSDRFRSDTFTKTDDGPSIGEPVLPPTPSPIAPTPEASKPLAPREKEPPPRPENPQTREKPIPPPVPVDLPKEPQQPLSPPAALHCDVLVGSNSPSPQFGLLGRYAGRTIGFDLNQTHTISIFGVQGGGKSYTLGTVLEMALRQNPGINQLPRPLGAVVFHYSQTQDYQPEFTSMRQPNDDARSIAALARDYQASTAGIDEVVLLTSPDKLEERVKEYPNLTVLPLRFGSAELQASHWRFLMGAVGNQAAYIRQLTQLMRARRNNLTLEGLRADIESSDLPDPLKKLASMRLDFAASYIDDSVQLSDVLKPGRLVIVDVRDEFIEKDEALGLFVVLLQIFAASTDNGVRFNKVVVFDEAHKYIQDADLIDAVVEVVREMRHKGTSIIVASQDPLSVPLPLIELSSTIILHKFSSPGWLKHIQKAVTALANLTPELLGRLVPGEGYVWAKESTDVGFTREAFKVHMRPRFSKHGGATKTAL